MMLNRKLKFTAICWLLLGLQSVWAADNVYWTVKATGGVMATSNGSAALNLSNNPGKYPNPSGSEWVACQNNWVYFNKDINGNAFNEVYVDRMMAIALAAQKTQSSIRVSIKHDGNGYCYTNQMYDLGRNVYDQ